MWYLHLLAKHRLIYIINYFVFLFFSFPNPKEAATWIVHHLVPHLAPRVLCCWAQQALRTRTTTVGPCCAPSGTITLYRIQELAHCGQQILYTSFASIYVLLLMAGGQYILRFMFKNPHQDALYSYTTASGYRMWSASISMCNSKEL